VTIAQYRALIDSIVRGADHGAYFPVEPQERHETRPGVFPEPDDSRVALLHFPAEFGEPVQRAPPPGRAVSGLSAPLSHPLDSYRAG
jgi:hypothetical protein